MRTVIRRKIEAASNRKSVDLEEPKLTAEQAAAKLGISPKTLRARFGHTPGVIRIGRGRRQLIRWPESVVRRILEANTVR